MSIREKYNKTIKNRRKNNKFKEWKKCNGRSLTIQIAVVVVVASSNGSFYWLQTVPEWRHQTHIEFNKSTLGCCNNCHLCTLVRPLFWVCISSELLYRVSQRPSKVHRLKPMATATLTPGSIHLKHRTIEYKTSSPSMTSSTLGTATFNYSSACLFFIVFFFSFSRCSVSE